MLIGSLITFIPCILIYPQTAHSDFKEFLSTWVSSLSSLLELSIRYYAEENHDPQAVSKMEGLIGLLQMKLGLVDLFLNNVASEPSYSYLTYNQIQPLTAKIRILTQQVIFMHASVMEYRKWLEKGRQIPEPEKLAALSEKVIENLKTVLEGIARQIENPKPDNGDTTDQSNTPFLKAGTKQSSDVTVKSDLMENLSDKKLNDEQNVQSNDSANLHSTTIETLVKFEFHLRQSLDYLYTEAEQKKNESGWTQDTESILTIYHFSLALEEVSKNIIELSTTVRQEIRTKHWYFPLKKWIPFKYSKSILNALNPMSYHSSDKKFSLAVWYASLYNFVKVNIWPLKSAVVMSLFLVLFLEPSSKSFYNQYGLSGGLITLLIVVYT
jgi:hypothetical protein